MFKFLVVAIFNYCLVLGCNGDEGQLITIPQGTIQGYHMLSYSGRTFSAFEGIPYAKPPVGELRFADPQPAEPWNDTLFANKTFTCMSYLPFPGFKGIAGTEDCLYLYVYVPLENIKGDENLDVIVHIHGGAFMFGAPSMMSGPTYLMDKDCVYVSMNYRLNILGFLSTEDNEVSGNSGLKDQTMALKWIQDNIKYFGGNPDSVTITGLSAGAASVHYHYLSPLSKGLFHKGFSQSGTAISSWALIKNPLSKAKSVAKHLNCPVTSTKEMVECMRKTSGKDLLTAMTKLFIYMESIPFILFGPVIEKGDNTFLSEHPYKLIKEGKVYDVPWITSNVKDEGIFPTAVIVMRRKMSEFDKHWNEIIPYIVDFYETVDDADEQIKISQAIRSYYYEGEPVTEENAYSMVKIFSDRFFFNSAEQALRLQSQVTKSPNYYYFFTYLIKSPLIPIFGMKRGVSHGDDGGLLFKMITSPPKLEPDDEKMMKLFTEFIFNFANSSIPTMKGVEWLPVKPDSDKINILKVESPDSVTMIEMDHIGTSTEFWNTLPIKENEKLFVELV